MLYCFISLFPPVLLSCFAQTQWFYGVVEMFNVQLSSITLLSPAVEHYKKQRQY